VKLSTRGDYAVRALLELSREAEQRPIPLGELSSRTAIPPKYLEQILMRLRSARIVDARRGAAGGYLLARPAEAITVGEVVRTMEGPLAPTLCASRTQHAPCPAYRCPTEEGCVMRDLWLEVRDAIAGILDRTTFADLARRDLEQHREAIEPSRVSYQI
jgi:Rrf2 family protein